jgi:hypothetical protein
VASPEMQLREPNQAAVTPNVSNVQTPQEQQPPPEEEDDDDIMSHFSEPEPSSLESFPESPAAPNATTNSNRKRPLEESEDLQQSDAKRRNKNSRQTTLSSWFVKTT